MKAVERKSELEGRAVESKESVEEVVTRKKFMKRRSIHRDASCCRVRMNREEQSIETCRE